jgi:hypothetical protein
MQKTRKQWNLLMVGLKCPEDVGPEVAARQLGLNRIL